MHQPPRWVIDSSERLSLAGFQKAFGEAWAGIEQRFLKIECWQSYKEADGVSSQQAFQDGDIDLARELLREESEGDQPLYDEVKARGLEFTRVRPIILPLTDYLQYEMINYEIRRDLGENVEFINPPGPVENYFDFLLFDETTALVHDYGPGPIGHQTGGWVTHSPEILSRLNTLASELRTHHRPWPEWQ